MLILLQGLGTSNDQDARDYFKNMKKHMIPFMPAEPEDRNLVDLAFSKKKIEERKEWLRQFKVCYVLCCWTCLIPSIAWDVS